MSFRSAQSDLTVDDFEESETKITACDVKYVEICKSNNVGTCQHDFRSHRQHQSKIFAQKYLAFLFVTEISGMG